jgi:hypothetical protein
MATTTLSPDQQPSVPALRALDETLVLPDTYRGENDSMGLATFFMAVANKGANPFTPLTFEAVQPQGSATEDRLYADYLGFLFALAQRDGLRLPTANEAEAAWWNFYEYLPLEEDVNALYYLLTLIAHYGHEFDQQTGTFTTILNIEHSKRNKVYPSIAQIEKFASVMNTIIYDDGVMLSHEQFWYATKFWDYEEIRKLLLSGQDYEYVMRLVAVGAGDTVEEAIAAMDTFPRTMVENFTKGMFRKG